MDKKTTQVKGILIVSMLACASLIAVFALSPLDKGTYTYSLNSFTDYNQLRDFLYKRYESSTNDGRSYGGSPQILFEKSEAAPTMNGAADMALGGEEVDYSTTNIQVEGVDEPDIVKTDGTYLYIVANNTIYIIKAYPAEEAAILSTIHLDESASITNIFIYGDRLVVFGNTWVYPILYSEEGKGQDILIDPYWGGGSGNALINVYDVSDPANPLLIKEVKIDGSYFDARLIGEYVYVVATEYTYEIYQLNEENNITLNVPEIKIDNSSEVIPPGDIYYVDVPELSDTMTHVISINLDTNDVVEKSFLLGSSSTMYVSSGNIFLATSHSSYYPLLMRGAESSTTSNEETTILHKISITSGEVTYIAQGEVPGHILNQFSMDEHEGFFRIATTVGETWNTETLSTNNIYILDENLQQVGQVEGLAPGESIYAVRFLGDRAYLVTFVQVDPLFCIDLSDPYNPRVLGELKIPGYSDYLHPFDENHIIGIGKEVNASIDADKVHTPGAIYYTAILGLKMALFDVTDIENPVEIAKVVIGDRGTDSPVLYDHKAFLFDREKELLVIPVSVMEQPENQDEYSWGQLTFQGAYVYRLSLENGFELKGAVTHRSNEQLPEDNYWWWYSNTDVTRTLYIGNILYTISGSMVKMNNLEDLSDINSITFA